MNQLARPKCPLYYLSFILLSLSTVAVAQVGDFDGDGNLDCADINALTSAVADGSQTTGFDLNGDGHVSRLDVTEWLIVAGNHNIGAPYLMGDSNLSGQVDASDYGGEWDAFRFTRSDG
ncbi:MAG: dockerin type I domain-containing protein [Planctomycetota bacterium]